MKNKKDTISLNNSLAYLAGRFRDGLCAIPKSLFRLLLTALYWGLVLLNTAPAASDRLARLLTPLTWVQAVVVFVAVVTVSAIPAGTLHIANSCRRIGLVNSCGEVPLMTKRCYKDKRLVVELFIQGLPLSVFQDHKSELESASNYRIANIEQGRNQNTIRLTLAPGNTQLPDMVRLPRLTLASSEIAFGVSLDGPVVGDLNKLPHWLIGGATNSGKTTLIISLIFQLLCKLDSQNKPLVDVYVIDLKGGQDYPPKWRTRDCSFCVTAEDALSVLGGLVNELERRLEVFAQVSSIEGVPCSNLDDFNRLRPGNTLRRNVIVVDELAEITDVTGMDKPHKELANAVIGKMATIARRGRSVGMNLVIGVQRGDATVVPGQIKSNISGRVCGVADDVLSQIILGNTDADDLVPKHGRGLFLNHEGVLFRGYLPPEIPRYRADLSDNSNDKGGTNEHSPS